ncbi:MAG: lipid II flippase MurJ [Paenibacillaceae bacterium]
MSTNTNTRYKATWSVLRQPIVVLAIVNVLVAFIAFIKDIALAAYVGTTLHADALTIAYFIPDSISNNMFAAAISIVCVPVFSRLAALEQINRLRLAIRQVSVRFIAISILMMVLAYAFSGVLIEWKNGSSNTVLDHETLALLKILLPTILLFVIFAIGTAVLQTLQRFIVPALAPLLLNLIFLGGVIYCSIAGIAIEIGVGWIALAITMGVLLTTIWIVITWYKAMSLIQATQPSIPLVSTVSASSDWLDMIRIFVPYVVILFSIQAVYFAERYIITAFDSGAAAALNYAYRLTQFPVWVFVSAVSVVILPSISKHLTLGQRGEANLVMVNAFRGVILIVVPSMLFLFFLREPLISALFQRGAFDSRSVIQTTSILEGYSLSVLSQSISLVCLRYFLAGRKLISVLSVYISTSSFTILMDIWLANVLGPRGIGYGAAIGALLNAVILLYMLWRNTRPSHKAINIELKRFRKTLMFPFIFFPTSGLIWFLLPVHTSVIAMIFISLTGCAFLLLFFFVLQRYWPELLKAINNNRGKG